MSSLLENYEPFGNATNNECFPTQIVYFMPRWNERIVLVNIQPTINAKRNFDCKSSNRCLDVLVCINNKTNRKRSTIDRRLIYIFDTFSCSETHGLHL